MKEKDKDKRLLLPDDEFEEEASEGLGQLNREEAAGDLRELRGRMATRLRKPLRVWIPAAAAVLIILVASSVYFGLFRSEAPVITEVASANEKINDTALIAMAEPVKRDMTRAVNEVEVKVESRRSVAPVIPNNVIVADAEREAGEMVVTENNVLEENVAAGAKKDEQIVEVAAMPERAMAAQAVSPGRAEAKMAKISTDEMAGTDIKKSSDSDHPPQPVGGIKVLRSWIESNIRYPESIIPRTRQVINVTFKVMADSTLYDLKTDRTVALPFTEEAFRLLREGPGWTPAIRNGQVTEESVKVSIVFR